MSKNPEQISEAQRVFNIVVDHARNRPDIKPKCRLRYDGTACFMGALITDAAIEEYGGCVEYDFAHPSAQGMLKESGVALQELPEKYLGRLQFIHDACSINEWEDQLKIFANKYDLAMPINIKSMVLA